MKCRLGPELWLSFTTNTGRGRTFCILYWSTFSSQEYSLLDDHITNTINKIKYHLTVSPIHLLTYPLTLSLIYSPTYHFTRTRTVDCQKTIIDSLIHSLTEWITGPRRTVWHTTWGDESPRPSSSIWPQRTSCRAFQPEGTETARDDSDLH